MAVIGAAGSHNHPSANHLSDIVFTVAFAVLVTVAASMGRIWTWLVLAGGAAAVTAGRYLFVGVPLEALVLVAAAFDLPRRRLIGAVVGAVAVQLLLRVGDGPFFGSTALVATMLGMPVLASGLNGPRRRCAPD